MCVQCRVMNSHHIPVYSVFTMVSFWLNGWRSNIRLVDEFIYYEFYRSGCMCDHALFIQNRIMKKLFRHKFCEEVTEANGPKPNVNLEALYRKRDEK